MKRNAILLLLVCFIIVSNLGVTCKEIDRLYLEVLANSETLLARKAYRMGLELEIEKEADELFDVKIIFLFK